MNGNYLLIPYNFCHYFFVTFSASRHNGSDPFRVFGGVNSPPRPTILGRHSLFNRFGEEEENALKEFQFLESFPSQSDVIGSCDQGRPFVQSQNPDRNEDALLCHSINFTPTSLSRPSPPTDLKNLRSSEPCPDELIYPISSSRTQCLDDDSVFVKSSSSLPCTSQTNNDCCPPLNRTLENLSTSDKNIAKNSGPTRISKLSTDENIKQSFRSFEKVSNLRSNDLNDNNKTYKCNVPLPRLDKANCISDLYKKSNNSGDRQSVVESRNTDGRNLCNKSNFSVKTEANKLLKGNSSSTQIKNNLKANTEETKLVDTRSISNVKEIIEKLNNKNSSSGKLIHHSGNNRNGRNSNSCNSNNSDITSSSTRNSKPSFISTKPCPPSVLAATSNRCSDSLSHNAEPSNSSAMTNENTNSNVSKKNCQSKRNPKLPGSSLIKRLTSNSFQSKDASASLPPKGGNSSSTRTGKVRENIPSRLSSRAIGVVGKGLRSPRLPRLKLNGSRGDPLSSFNEKGMCDSGSSEGSDKGCGRISISDSCAEIFSLGESGDEVFLRHS
ncbi:hypothetical protein Anas_10457 [Armadillidium nasatum]|uniref:Uncharacterized protein n=1 Tax=Armadillidium nasatum TaxID=96803 RepID=A0A5N5T8D3_9CRUS|nr:hypothetical protein Anas_10457 [Armadillidium nasatum]